MTGCKVRPTTAHPRRNRRSAKWLPKKPATPGRQPWDSTHCARLSTQRSASAPGSSAVGRPQTPANQSTRSGPPLGPRLRVKSLRAPAAIGDTVVAHSAWQPGPPRPEPFPLEADSSRAVGPLQHAGPATFQSRLVKWRLPSGNCRYLLGVDVDEPYLVPNLCQHHTGRQTDIPSPKDGNSHVRFLPLTERRFSKTEPAVRGSRISARPRLSSSYLIVLPRTRCDVSRLRQNRFR